MKNGREVEITEWEFDRTYPSDTPQIVTHPKQRSLGYDMLRVTANKTHNGVTNKFSVEARARQNAAFIDPYNNEHLNSLNILVDKWHSLSNITYKNGGFIKRVNPIFYSVVVIGHYQPVAADIFSMEGYKIRAIELSVDNLDGELCIKSGLRVHGNVNAPKNEFAEVLPMVHTAVLLNFMDSIIPSDVLRLGLTQQTDRRAKQETPTPKAFPPTRRRKPGR
jgi:hypothetical protein